MKISIVETDVVMMLLVPTESYVVITFYDMTSSTE